jgi:peptide/nickel transport system ATP-binding protein
MIFLTHDVSIIGSVVDRIGVMYCGQVVEYGNVMDVFKKPAHPYTFGLMNAIPSLRDDITTRKAIPGYPPNLLNLPKGCRFGPRCFLCEEGRCKAENITVDKMIDIGEGQLTLCPAWKKVKEKCL